MILPSHNPQTRSTKMKTLKTRVYYKNCPTGKATEEINFHFNKCKIRGSTNTETIDIKEYMGSLFPNGTNIPEYELYTITRDSTNTIFINIYAHPAITTLLQSNETVFVEDDTYLFFIHRFEQEITDFDVYEIASNQANRLSLQDLRDWVATDIAGKIQEEPERYWVELTYEQQRIAEQAAPAEANYKVYTVSQYGVTETTIPEDITKHEIPAILIIEPSGANDWHMGPQNKPHEEQFLYNRRDNTRIYWDRQKAEEYFNSVTRARLWDHNIKAETSYKVYPTTKFGVTEVIIPGDIANPEIPAILAATVTRTSVLACDCDTVTKEYTFWGNNWCKSPNWDELPEQRFLYNRQTKTRIYLDRQEAEKYFQENVSRKIW
jgi:hypothetical protein